MYDTGYDACFSGYGGFISPDMRGGILPRVAVPAFASLLHLEMYLTGCMNWFYNLKRQAGMIACP